MAAKQGLNSTIDLTAGDGIGRSKTYLRCEYSLLSIEQPVS